MIKNSLALFLFYLLMNSCTAPEPGSVHGFSGIDPGQPKARIESNRFSLENNAMKVIWLLEDSSICIKSIYNKYDSTHADLENVILFSFEMEDHRVISNLDLKLSGNIKEQPAESSGELPTAAFHVSGKEFSGQFMSKDGNISVIWSAQMRDGSNYVRQELKISAMKYPVKIRKITFWDGQLAGAEIAGYVIGSPAVLGNFFFGYEHPTAQSKSLIRKDAGYINLDISGGSSALVSFDVSEMQEACGKYILIIQPEYVSNAGFNIQSATLYNNNQEVSKDIHPFNFEGGRNYYFLDFSDDVAEAKYQIKMEVEKGQGATVHAFLVKETDDLLNFYVMREDELTPGNVITASSVTGVSPKGQLRRSFLYYLERERAMPYNQFLHYNSWWDISGPENYLDENNTAEVISAWGDKFINPYHVDFQSFALDDGWDDFNNLWGIDTERFPGKFTKLAGLCRQYGAGLGLWMSPFGGYGTQKEARLELAKRDGFEINSGGLSLAGPKYYDRYRGTALLMMRDYDVNYFKFDGFGGWRPEFLPDMEAGVRLIREMRKQDPEVFVNATTGTWPSPFWLFHVDATWRQGADMGAAGVGSNTQQWITYRDGSLFNNIVLQGKLYPINSVMLPGVIYAKLDLAKAHTNEGLKDFKDQARSFFGTGTNIQELYISHDLMTEDYWKALAEAAKWARENEDVLVDTHWIGGRPFNLEVYGFASWIPRKGIITLRNPANREQRFELDIQKVFELPPDSRAEFELKSPWKEDENDPSLKAVINSRLPVILKPFEVIVLEAYPR
ncbi:MAG TPA: hypothetical protein VI583_04020 [Cyclobacteriaceae bacterium]|nr:hypothetical protein [Cyclobacteriaceae bacterium]